MKEPYKLGHEKRLKAYIVNYADDLVICGRSRAEEALATMRAMMSKLKLTVNDTKTRVCKLPEEKFDFLGYTFGRMSVYGSIGMTDWSPTEVIRPPNHDAMECRDYCCLGHKGLVPSGFLADRLTNALHPFLRRSRS